MSNQVIIRAINKQTGSNHSVRDVYFPTLKKFITKPIFRVNKYFLQFNSWPKLYGPLLTITDNYWIVYILLLGAKKQVHRPAVSVS